METVTKPEVGMGATTSYGVDSLPMTVIAVNESGKTIHAQRDSARAEDSTMNNRWIIEQDPSGIIEVFTLRNNGRYVLKGDSQNGRALSLGHRHMWYCYEF